jgi:hypothetical protein
MTTAADTKAKTPGYNCRLEIFFTHTNGRKVAYRFSRFQFRAFRMPLAEAELAQATGTADILHCHPMRPCETCRNA